MKKILDSYRNLRETYLKTLKDKRAEFIDDLLEILVEYNKLTESYFSIPDKTEVTEIEVSDFEVSLVVEKYNKTYYRIPITFFEDKDNFIKDYRRRKIEDDIKTYKHNLNCAEEEVTCLTKEIKDLENELKEINKK